MLYYIVHWPKLTNHCSLELTDNVPNAFYHYAIGDIAQWPGIKRCGAAMHHGHYTAMNVHQKLLAVLNQSPSPPTLNELSADVLPGIGLAVGKKAVSYYPTTGVNAGEDVMKLFFEEDLGFKSRFFLFFSSVDFWGLSLLFLLLTFYL